jgi:hypothetical protein
MSRFATLVKFVVAASLLYATQASAAFHFYSGDTTGSPTYNRTLEGEPPASLSAVGTDVAYDTLTFQVSADGVYRFRSFVEGAFSTPAWDNFLFLYSGSFNPSAALTSVLVGNDDFNGNIGRSGFDLALNTGTTYVLVTTGFTNEDFGIYRNLILGPGSIVPVPEPGTYALMFAGLAVVGFVASRRRLR